MEIGSEFYMNSSTTGINEYFDLSNYSKRFVLSGRTGLYLIADELKIKTSISNILMPDYCCSSMIVPFVSREFSVSFYDSFDLKNIVVDETVQAILIMDYFGFISDQTLKFAAKCKNVGKIIIVDATQTAFSRSNVYNLADYIVVSYRKWLDSLCAVVYSKNGFSSTEAVKEQRAYNTIWRNAAKLKERYIRTSLGDKQEFLALYAKANCMLDEDYVGYKANPTEIDLLGRIDSSFIREIRRNNASYLITEVKKMSAYFNVQLLFDRVEKEDCPLFVPILVNETKRKLIRDELTKNSIYCPIHWPIDERYPHKKTLYHQKELSLICDQRYGIKEMRKQVSILSQVLSTTDN